MAKQMRKQISVLEQKVESLSRINATLQRDLEHNRNRSIDRETKMDSMRERIERISYQNLVLTRALGEFVPRGEVADEDWEDSEDDFEDFEPSETEGVSEVSSDK